MLTETTRLAHCCLRVASACFCRIALEGASLHALRTAAFPGDHCFQNAATAPDLLWAERILKRCRTYGHLA